MDERFHHAKWLFAVVAVVALACAALAAPPPALALNGAINPQPGDGSSVAEVPAFAWDPVEEAASYRVQVATDEAFTAVRYQADVVSPFATPKVDFAPGTYYWRVQAIATDGTGTYPEVPRSFTRDPVAGPTPEAHVPVLDFPQDAPVLRWTPMSGVTGYELQLSTSEAFPPAATTTEAVPTASYALTELEPQDRVLYWRVRANYLTATAGSTTTSKTEWSAVSSFSTDWEDSDPATATNSTPQLNAPAPNAAAAPHPRFSWEPVKGATRYRLQISPAPDFTTNVTIDRTLGRTTYSGTGSLESDTYYWHVAALDQRGSQGPWSEPRQFNRGWVDANGLSERPTVTAADSDPGAPGIQLPRDEFLVTWTPVPGASHYEVQVSASPSFDNVNTMETCKTPHRALTSVRFGAYRRSIRLSACDFYRTSGFDIDDYDTVYVRVRAVDTTTGSGSYPGGPVVGQVNSQWSTQSRGSGEPAPGPLAIALSDPSGGETMVGAATPTGPADNSQHTDAPVLSWNRVAGANYYLVALSIDRDFTSSELGDGDANNDYVVVPGTRLVLSEALKDNNAGQSLHWYVLPCRSWVNANEKDCPFGDEYAVNQDGMYRSFRKVAFAPRGLGDPDHPQDPPVTVDGEDVRLAWDDLQATETAAEAANVEPGRFFEKAGVRYYELEISRDPDFTDTNKRVLLTKTDATEITPEIAWDKADWYYWRVRGYDGGGNAQAWSVETCQAGSAVPCSFRFTTENAPSGTRVTPSAPMPSLSWEPTAATASYEVEVFSGDDRSFPLAQRVASDTAAYPAWTPTTTLPAGTYSWRVRKVDTFGAKGDWTEDEGNWLFTVGAAVVHTTAPDAGITQRIDELIFDWDSVPGAARYEIQVSTKEDFTSVYESAVTTNTSWSPTKAGGYAAGHYYWRVRALSTTSTANVLSTSEIRQLDVITPPAKVTNVVASASSSAKGTVTVTWTPRPLIDGGTKIIGYRVWFRVKGTSSWGNGRWNAGNVGADLVSGLANNTTYEFKVAAVSEFGSGPESSIVNATTPGLPTAPRVTVSAIDRGLRVSWSGATSKLPITAYQVWYKPVASTVWNKRLAAKSPLDLTGLSPTTAYHVQVAAMNAVGLGPFGTVTPIKPLSTPSAPRAVTLKHGSGKVTVTWAPPLSAGSSAVTSYVVSYRKANSTTWSTRSTTTRSTVLSLSAGQTYVLHVAARNAVGTGPVSQDVRFLVRAIPGRPISVAGRVTGASTLRTLTVTWRPPTVGVPITSYEVQVSLNGTTWSTIARTKATSCAWRSARKGKTYSIRVRANNPLGWGAYSSTVRVRA